MNLRTAMSETQPPVPYKLETRREIPLPPPQEGLPTHIPTSEPSTSSGSTLFGGILSFICIILLSLILRLAVPAEDSAVQLAVLLIAVGFAQVWLIFILLKSIRR